MYGIKRHDNKNPRENRGRMVSTVTLFRGDLILSPETSAAIHIAPPV